MRAVLAVMLLALPGLAAAEVSDKMPSIPAVLLQGAIVGTVLFVLCRYRWWLVALGALTALLFVTGTVDLWQDLPLRQALLHEQGASYFLALSIADALVIFGTLAGACLGWMRQRQPGLPTRDELPSDPMKPRRSIFPWKRSL